MIGDEKVQKFVDDDIIAELVIKSQQFGVEIEIAID